MIGGIIGEYPKEPKAYTDLIQRLIKMPVTAEYVAIHVSQEDYQILVQHIIDLDDYFLDNGIGRKKRNRPSEPPLLFFGRFRIFPSPYPA